MYISGLGLFHIKIAEMALGMQKKDIYNKEVLICSNNQSKITITIITMIITITILTMVITIIEITITDNYKCKYH